MTLLFCHLLFTQLYGLTRSYYPRPQLQGFIYLDYK